MKITNSLSLLALGLAFGILSPTNAQAATTGTITSQTIYLVPPTAYGPPTLKDDVEYQVSNTDFTTSFINLNVNMKAHHPGTPEGYFGDFWAVDDSFAAPSQSSGYITFHASGVGYQNWTYKGVCTLTSSKTEFGGTRQVMATNTKEQTVSY
ncbi:MAG TPA: hypothetical protein VF627_10405 [Abditibacterium sp.]|jgi:hypothetical protein